MTAFRTAKGLTVGALALSLRVGKKHVGDWCAGRAFPARKYWPKIVAAGIVTAHELDAARPRRVRFKGFIHGDGI